MSVAVINARPHAKALRAPAPALKYLSLGRSDVGAVRATNEDAFVDRPEIGLWAVADGMGGHDAGDVASGAVAASLTKIGGFSSAYGFRDQVCRALQQVNAELQERALETLGGVCGSTVAVLLIHQGYYACVWAGDSRIYLYRDGEMRRLTRDHSLVQDMVDAGRLSASQARSHGASNLITRAVGASTHLELASVHGVVRGGDRFLLCSDGLTNYLSDAELASHVRNPPIASALERMISTAIARGGSDNITALAVAAETRVDPLGAAEIASAPASPTRGASTGLLD